MQLLYAIAQPAEIIMMPEYKWPLVVYFRGCLRTHKMKAEPLPSEEQTSPETSVRFILLTKDYGDAFSWKK